MLDQSRTSRSVRNSMVAMVCYVCELLLQFFSRRIFLEYLGTEVLGLNTTVVNLLQFLNIAELGISYAIGFTLYKPLLDNDRTAIADIVSLNGAIYRRIAVIVAVSGGVLMLFFPYIFAKTDLPLWYAYASFAVMLFSTLLAYTVNYRQILLTASQQDYKFMLSYRTVMMVKALAQMAAVSHCADGYVWWLALEAIFAVAGSCSLHIVVRRSFPWLSSSLDSLSVLRRKYPLLVTKLRQVFFHKFGEWALTQSSPLIIYAYGSLTEVAVYGNYIIITGGMRVLVDALFNSVSAGVGNLVAENDRKKISDVFGELFCMRMYIVATVCLCTYMLIPPFISLWIGPEYLLPDSTLILLVVLLFIGLSRFTVSAFISAFGLYSDIWAPISESVLNIGLSVLFGSVWGLDGVISGVIVSQVVIIMIWKPYYLFTREMKGTGRAYVKCWVMLIAVMATVTIFIFWLLSVLGGGFGEFASGSWQQFASAGLALVTVCGVLMFGAMYVVLRPFRKCCRRMIMIYHRVEK